MCCCAGVQAHAAGQVLRQLEPLQQQLSGLSSGSLEGGWEGALELVAHLGDALRQVSDSKHLKTACIAETQVQHYTNHTLHKQHPSLWYLAHPIM
jgi:hypothetical protein